MTQLLGSGTGQTTTHPKWNDGLGTAVIPVNGINTSEEYLVIRKGEQVAVASKLSASTVAAIQGGPQPEEMCDGGTVVSGMRTDTEHDAGDWRRGLSWKQVINGTKEPHRN